MRTLVDHLAQYAAYHRDRRNIATHFVGIPMITFSVVALLSRPALISSPIPISPAIAAAVLAIAFYARLDRRYAAAMSLFLGACIMGGAALANLATAAWLGISLGLFVVGWIIQFVGHYFEGRKPAFVDDLVGLLVGPLFILAELGFILGARLEVKDAVEKVAGPTLIRARARARS